MRTGLEIFPAQVGVPITIKSYFTALHESVLIFIFMPRNAWIPALAMPGNPSPSILISSTSAPSSLASARPTVAVFPVRE
ncbi:Uncharacterised protein [uncultured archaeon]|nr:Uncharacterised protein [uncultured archaeon]